MELTAPEGDQRWTWMSVGNTIIRRSSSRNYMLLSRTSCREPSNPVDVSTLRRTTLSQERLPISINSGITPRCFCSLLPGTVKLLRTLEALMIRPATRQAFRSPVVFRVSASRSPPVRIREVLRQHYFSIYLHAVEANMAFTTSLLRISRTRRYSELHCRRYRS